ncbi:ankyrin-3-like [Temnothorax curvispinosus]|uniref:Ankyrin-3-like n=1 Tax=Temnothorax curvispinosus TaxID=300111 RepID=A0A6J1R6A5_9HYME|nr:ankyrin-3-like [Temnothorax curvispinosus]
MLLLQNYEEIDINAKGNNDWTILHIASQRNNLEMVEYLVDDKGSDVNVKIAFGLKPIHIAAREGCKDTLEFFISKGLSIKFINNKLDADNWTLLHYAASKGQLEVAKYLIAQGVDVNAKDVNRFTPMHIAAKLGYKDFIQILLKNGAVYNAVDHTCKKPLKMSNDENVINLLESTEKLFEAVKRNGSSDVENYIKAGAVVNAKNVNGTSLHYAAWKGYNSIVNILLQNKADSNAVGKKGYTPLHYAAKFSHLEIVKLLLSNGAVYNAVSDGGKTPLDFTTNKNITSLFKLLSDSFKNIKNNNFQVVNDLNKIKDIDTVKAIMNACNKENRTLVVAVVHNNFSKVEQLKEVSQSDVSAQLNVGLVLMNQGDYQRALCIFKSVFKKRKEILGSDNPGTLDIQIYIGKISYAQGAYQDALNTFEEIFQKQKEMLGLNDKSTLSTKSTIALVLHRQGRNEEAFNIYQEVCQKQEEILGPNHLDTLKTYFHMAMVLEEQGKHEEALNINRTVFEKSKTILSADDPTEFCVFKKT